MKIIAVETEDGLIFIHPNQSKYGEGKTPYEECKTLQAEIAKGNDVWFIVDSAEVPSKDQIESRKQYYIEQNAIKIDKGWVRQVMPWSLIKSKELDYIKEQIGVALDSDTPDINTATKLQYDYLKLAHNDSPVFWYEKAKTNLERAEKDTTLVEAKLQRKIAHLTVKDLE